MLKERINYFFEEIYWFLRYRLSCHYSLLRNLFNLISKFFIEAQKPMFFFEGYIYVLFVTLLWVLILDPQMKFIIILTFVIIYFHYKDYKGGNYKAYMRRKKGYRLLRTNLGKKEDVQIK